STYPSTSRSASRAWSTAWLAGSRRSSRAPTPPWCSTPPRGVLELTGTRSASCWRLLLRSMPASTLWAPSAW
ncbi:unnamed protein product, partial [Prorocentrum cordatum]